MPPLGEALHFPLLALGCAAFFAALRAARARPPLAARRPATFLLGAIPGGGDRGAAPMDPPLALADDLLWLRDDARADAAVLAHLAAENAFTARATARLAPAAAALGAELLARLQETDASAPYASGAFEYCTRTEAGRPHGIHARRARGARDDAPPAPWHDYLDENELAEEEGAAFVDVAAVEPSPTHATLAFAVDFAGDEVYEVRFRALGGGGAPAPAGDVLEETSGDVAWASERALLYLTMDAAHRPFRAWRHDLGTPQAADELLYEEADERFWLSLRAARSGAFVFLAADSKTTSEVRAVALAGPDAGRARLVRAREEGVLYAVDHVAAGAPAAAAWGAAAPPPRGALAVRHNARGATNFALAAAPLLPPGGGAAAGEWRDVVPASAEAYYEEIDAFARALVVWGRADGAPQVWVADAAAFERAAAAPAAAPAPPLALARARVPEAVYALEAGGGNADWGARGVRARFSSPRAPPCDVLVPFDGAPLELLRQRPAPGVDAGAYATARLEARAPDGARVPVSLVWRPSALGGRAPPAPAAGAPWLAPAPPPAPADARAPFAPAPLVLYAYGAYGLSSDARFSTSVLALCDRGVVYATAHVRGGGERGRAWYDDGKGAKKRNTFSDYFAVADMLIARGFTEAGRIAAWGASAGGLVCGAALNERPELFGAVVSEVGFVDVLQSIGDPTLPLAVTEREEWGDSNSREGYEAMRLWSPLDSAALRGGRARRLPPTLLTAGLHDTRVGFHEAAKFAQRLRAATAGDEGDILLRVDMGAGHFSQSDRYAHIKEEAFVLAWLVDKLCGPRAE